MVILIRAMADGRFEVSHVSDQTESQSSTRYFDDLTPRLDLAYTMVAMLPISQVSSIGCNFGGGHVEIFDDYFSSSAMDSAGRA